MAIAAMRSYVTPDRVSQGCVWTSGVDVIYTMHPLILGCYEDKLYLSHNTCFLTPRNSSFSYRNQPPRRTILNPWTIIFQRVLRPNMSVIGIAVSPLLSESPHNRDSDIDTALDYTPSRRRSCPRGSDWNILFGGLPQSCGEVGIWRVGNSIVEPSEPRRGRGERPESYFDW